MLTKFTAKQFEVFAMNMLLDRGFPGELPLKLWKVEYSVRRYGSDNEVRELVSIEYNTNYTDDLAMLGRNATASHYNASEYYAIDLKADYEDNPFGVDVYISAQVAYSFTQEDKDLLEAIGKIEVDRQPTVRKYLVCGNG